MSIPTRSVRRPTAQRPARRHPLASGKWRPNHRFASSGGLKLTMRAEPHLTDPLRLRVPLRFQTPSIGDLARPEDFNHATYDTLAAGQRSRPMGDQLQQVSVQTMLLDPVAQNFSDRALVAWPFAPDPQAVLEELRCIAGMRRAWAPTPFRLVLENAAVWDRPIVNMTAWLTHIEPTQKGGEVGTEYLTATFLECIPDSVGRRQRRRRPRSHRLEGGDTLYGLATRYYHRPSFWTKIEKANGIRGVTPGSASELAAWAKKHHKSELAIPTA